MRNNEPCLLRKAVYCDGNNELSRIVNRTYLVLSTYSFETWQEIMPVISHLVHPLPRDEEGKQMVLKIVQNTI